ncbi:2-polyprenylphenol hydroxylase [Corynebacterium hindlerae]|uniref:2-polyprenylphenol hydroxylase n=1 Tax=Corynebacterium hindlerae TaxID=699041 RepID=UPI001AD7C033|nr:2-polyprenylphenol hydroxylase [Corynebacterium hindlerae]QTH59588.1 2-polyprenylphenol hydroxylase [Corynebacterium hindlerae]
MPSLVSRELSANAAEFRERVLGGLYQKHPETRLWFPAHAEDAHTHLVFALTFLLDNDPDEALVANLAREHRAFGLTSDIARSGISIIRDAIHHFCTELPYSEVHEADQRLQWLAEILCTTLDATPAPGWGKVVEVQRRARRITVVRLECPEPPRYLPGQYLGVSSPLIQGYWPRLAPAMPYNDAGLIEFHLDHSPALEGLAVSQPGDEWFFGPAHGNLQLLGESDALLISHGTGLAPLRALILDAFTTGKHRRTHLYYGAEYPGELYELAGLWQLAAAAPWLSVTPVVEKPADAWWVGATEHSRAPRGLHLQQEGRLEDVVTAWGAWGDREVLIAGPREWAQRMRNAMLTAGTPADNIQVLGL